MKLHIKSGSEDLDGTFGTVQLLVLQYALCLLSLSIPHLYVIHSFTFILLFSHSQPLMLSEADHIAVTSSENTCF